MLNSIDLSLKLEKEEYEKELIKYQVAIYLLGYQVAGVTRAAGVKEDGSTTPLRPLSAVFADLVPYAKAHDGLPR